MKFNNSNKFLCPLLAMAMGGFCASAVEVTSVKAGMLADAVGADTLATSLTVRSGALNAADFAFISDRMPNLADVDISGCSVEAYRGDALPYTRLMASPAATLPDYAFLGLKELHHVALPAGLKAIGTAAFSGSGITDIEIPASVTLLGDFAFMRCTGLTSVVLPASLASMGRDVFANCSSLASVTFTDDNTSLSALPEGAFAGCVSLRELDLTALINCDNIGPWALSHMSGLTALSLPENIASLGRAAMIADSGVDKMVLPGSLESLDSNAMSGMSGLSSVDAIALRSVPSLGDSVFSSVDCSKVLLLTFDSAMKSEFQAADQWKEFNIMTKEEATGNSVPVTDSNALTVESDGVTLSVSASEGLSEVAVYDASGRRVAMADAVDNHVSLAVGAWPRGVYLVVTNIGVRKITI